MELDLETLTDEELEQVSRKSHELLARRREQKHQEVLKDAKRLLASIGLSFRDAERLEGGRTTDRKTTRGKAKTQTLPKGMMFVNPANPTQTWKGKGRKGTWLLELEERGEAPEPVPIP